MPEERWWLFTMTSAATGHAIQGRNKGWRKAVHYALTENPVMDMPHAPPPVFELGANAPLTEQPVKKTRSARQVRKAG